MNWAFAKFPSLLLAVFCCMISFVSIIVFSISWQSTCGITIWCKWTEHVLSTHLLDPLYMHPHSCHRSSIVDLSSMGSFMFTLCISIILCLWEKKKMHAWSIYTWSCSETAVTSNVAGPTVSWNVHVKPYMDTLRQWSMLVTIHYIIMFAACVITLAPLSHIYELHHTGNSISASVVPWCHPLTIFAILAYIILLPSP